MIKQSCKKWLGRFFTALVICCVLPLTVFSGAVSLNDIEGSWRNDAVLSDGIRIQSHLVVNQRGEYTEYSTNQITGQKHSGTLAGTLCISNDWLITTITNDFVKHTLLPRPGCIWKVVGFGPHHLSLVGPDGSNRVDYLRDSNVTNLIKPPQGSAALEKAKKIQISSVKFDGLPLTLVITMLQDQSVKCDPDRKGVKISLGPDAKQLADAGINLDLKDVTLAETLGRVSDSVGLEMQATDTELLFVLKKSKH